jgi:hypothetical protein
LPFGGDTCAAKRLRSAVSDLRIFKGIASGEEQVRPRNDIA